MSQVGIEPVEIEVAASTAAQLHTSSSWVPAEIGAAMRAAFERLAAFVASRGLQQVAPPRAIYTEANQQGTTFTVAIPIRPPENRVSPEGGVEVAPLPAQRALRFTHHGPYDQLRVTYGKITAWLMGQGLIDSEAGWAKYMPMWEEYTSDPAVTPPAELITHIFLPAG